eukprot:385132_1
MSVFNKLIRNSLNQDQIIKCIQNNNWNAHTLKLMTAKYFASSISDYLQNPSIIPKLKQVYHRICKEISINTQTQKQFGGGGGNTISNYFNTNSNKKITQKQTPKLKLSKPKMKLPNFKSYNKKILPFKTTKKAFPAFPWRKWIPAYDKNHKHEYTDAYLCIKTVGDLCKDEFKYRTTKRVLTRGHSGKHHKQHRGKPKDLYQRVTEFLYVSKTDKNNIEWVCYIGEIDMRPEAVKKRKHDPKHWAIAGFFNIVEKDKNNVQKNVNANKKKEKAKPKTDEQETYVTKQEMIEYFNSMKGKQKETPQTPQKHQTTLHSYSNSNSKQTTRDVSLNRPEQSVSSIFYANDKLKTLSHSFKQQRMSKYNFELNYGLTPAEIFQHDYIQNHLIITVIQQYDIIKLQNDAIKMIDDQEINFKANDVTVHCRQCAKYYQCATRSKTTYCCPDHQRRNNIFIKASELNSRQVGAILLDQLAIHSESPHHMLHEEEFYEHDMFNRTLTYVQVTKALTVILENTPDKSFEVIQACDEEFGISGNNNNSRKRMSVIRKVMDQAITFNTRTYINTPSEKDRSFNVRWNSLHADTMSIKPKKGEMVDIVTRTDSEQKPLILGWPQHEYSSKHTVFNNLDKARLVVRCLKECGSLPTALQGMSVNGAVTLILYSLVGGDSKYIGFIKWLNIALAEIDLKLKIYAALTGSEVVDDNHVLENAFKMAKKGHILLIAVGKMSRAATAYASGPKCTSIKSNSDVSVSYQASPEQRYATHYVRMIKPFVFNYKDTITLFQYCEWEKLDALLSAQFVIGNITSMDWMNPGLTMPINTYQRSGLYAGGVFIVDKLCHKQIFPKIIDSKKKLIFTIKHFVKNENLLIWKAFAESVQDTLPIISANIFNIIKCGKYDGVKISFSEEISDMQKRNWKIQKNINGRRVYIKHNSQRESLIRNVEQFITKMNINNKDLEFVYGDCYGDDGILDESLFDEKWDQYLQKIENEEFDPKEFANFAHFEYQEPENEEDLAVSINTFFEELESTESPFPLPVIMHQCSNAQLNRGILAGKYMLDSLQIASKYDDIHYNQLKIWDTYKEQEDAVMSSLYLPSFIDTICRQLDELEQDQKLRVQLVQQGTDRITKLYEEYQKKNADKETSILFPVTPEIFLLQIRQVKAWIMNFMLYDQKLAIQLKETILLVFLTNIEMQQYYNLFIKE